jgi:hypothetical protein
MWGEVRQIKVTLPSVVAYGHRVSRTPCLGNGRNASRKPSVHKSRDRYELEALLFELRYHLA